MIGRINHQAVVQNPTLRSPPPYAPECPFPGGDVAAPLPPAAPGGVMSNAQDCCVVRRRDL
jgi:hypothetical protein